MALYYCGCCITLTSHPDETSEWKLIAGCGTGTGVRPTMSAAPPCGSVTARLRTDGGSPVGRSARVPRRAFGHALIAVDDEAVEFGEVDL